MNAGSLLEGLRVQRSQHPAERVVTRNAVLQAQELPQQLFLGASQQRHVRGALRTTQHCSQRDEHDVVQIVIARWAPADLASLGKPSLNFSMGLPQRFGSPLQNPCRLPMQHPRKSTCDSPAWKGRVAGKRGEAAVRIGNVTKSPHHPTPARSSSLRCDAARRPSPSRAGLSHMAEEIEEEGIVPSGAFDFLAHGYAAGWERMMLTASLRKIARFSGALSFLVRLPSSSKTTSSTQCSRFSMPQ